MMSAFTCRSRAPRLLWTPVLVALATMPFGKARVEGVAPTRTIYIAARSDGEVGDGSAANPFNGSDAARLDALTASLPAGPIRVQFGLGVFVTNTGVPVKSGWTVQGEGPARTTIRLGRNVLREKGQYALLVGGYDFGGPATLLDYGCVRDLSIDGNRQGQPAYRLNLPGGIDAVILWARESRIENVHVYHTYNTPGEGFPVHIYSTGGTLEKPNRAEIEWVNVYFHEGYATAISVFDQTGGRITGGIRHCYVKGYGRPPSGVGFGAGGWVDFDVSDNRVSGMACGVTIDTHNYTRVSFLRNTFTGLYKFGFLVNGGGQYDSLTFRHNRTELIPSDGAHFKFDVTHLINLRVEENILISRGTPITVAMHGGEKAEGVIRANRLSPGLAFLPPKSSRLRVFDNRSLKAPIK